MEHGRIASKGADRWSKNSGSWLWSADEALSLTDALTATGGTQCIGSLVIDLDMGGGVRGTDRELVADDQTPEQRTTKLIQFLREGRFRWRFVLGPNQVATGGGNGA